ncbi:AmmeMemoRadiSam system protein B [Geothrix fuzhouensis]|uniref:AmmeMemoRadiSam system protein B n=1 Tax=Geothrix fuzhouensis TaxID=2966451 RepID=UPI0021487E49|nr:AmmeMemoRadiSam system protein B [Geothrix fuzhouensis]
MDTTMDVRTAAVAGTFYPRESGELGRTIQAMFADTAGANPWLGLPKALIVPHAGYIYSGPIAASAYAPLSRLRGIIQRVVLLGPTHHVPVYGLALPGASAFDTPLGRIPVDGAATESLRPLSMVTTSPAAHAREHSIEVQLPFLQQALGAFQLIPLAVGQAAAQSVAEVIEVLWGGLETLIVVSSDLSHYHSYDRAQELDRRTCASIADLELLASHDQACGATAVNGLLLAARHHRLTPHLLDLRNSGDTAGDRDHVVGYAAFAFTQEAAHDPSARNH